MIDHLIPPHGGKLVNLLAEAERAGELRVASRDWPSWDLTPRQLCDLELLLAGGFSPLQGFLARADYESVLASMRLASGAIWPIPVTLDVPEGLGRALGPGAALALRDPEGVLQAVLHVEDVWQPDRLAEAQALYGTTSREHPGVIALLEQCHPWYVGGRLEGIQLPVHHDFRPWRRGPQELRAEFHQLGWRRVVGFQTRELLHRAQQELTLRAAKQIEANLLIHPVVGASRPGDVDHYTRLRCYQAVLHRYPQHTVKLALLPLALRPAGPRDVLWQALVAKNHGCTHLIVAPGADEGTEASAAGLVRAHEQEIGVGVLPCREMVHVEELDTFLPREEAPPGARALSLPDADLRRRLAEGRELPPWFTFPEVARELRRRFPPRHRQGFTIFFTGLSGAGKSTLARILQVKFLEMGGRPVTLLDGDLVRKHLSSELGFSREHRDINIRRIGFVAAEITKNGGVALCAPIAPYDRVRREVRAMIEPWGGFVLVHVATPLAVCEERDRKGLYAKARAGLIREFTGISDPYEPPERADLVLDTTDLAPEEAAQEILLYLERQGYVGAAYGDL